MRHTLTTRFVIALALLLGISAAIFALVQNG
jgi:hypothetical protein